MSPNCWHPTTTVGIPIVGITIPISGIPFGIPGGQYGDFVAHILQERIKKSFMKIECILTDLVTLFINIIEISTWKINFDVTLCS